MMRKNNMYLLVFVFFVGIFSSCKNHKQSTISSSNNKFEYFRKDSNNNILSEKRFETFNYSDSLFSIPVAMKDFTKNCYLVKGEYLKVFPIMYSNLEYSEKDYFCYKSIPIRREWKYWHYIEYPTNIGWFKNRTENQQGRKNISIMLNFTNRDSIKALYVYWVNNKKNMGGGYENPKNSPHNRWGISYRTDTIFSNLSYKVIKSIFPDFQGYYSPFFIDTIKINNYLDSDTDEFYDSIKFVYNRFYIYGM